MIKNIFFCFALYFITSHNPAGCQDSGAFPKPVDDREDWIVGISAFQGSNLAEEDRYLTHSVPMLLKENLESIPSHFFAVEEKNEYQKAVIRKETHRLVLELGSLRKEKDELIFDDLKSQIMESKLKSYEERIREKIEHINALKLFKPAEIDFPEIKPVVVKSGLQTDQLLDAPVFSPLRLARQEEVNLLIWGRLEEIQGYLYLEVRAVDSTMEREVFSYHDAVHKEDLSNALEGLYEGLARVIWGRDWASLHIKPQPAESLVYLDGKYIGSGEVTEKFLLAGKKEIRIASPGFRTEVRTIELEPYITFELEMALTKAETETVLLESDPPGAMVYKGANWLGYTPLRVEKPQSPVRLLLRLDGFENVSVYLDAASTGDLYFSLAREGLDREEIQKKKRDKFYASFGLWAITLPLPIFFYGFASDYAFGVQQARLTGPTDEVQRLTSLGSWFYYAYQGALVINISLLIHTVISLVDYIGSADRKAD